MLALDDDSPIHSFISAVLKKYNVTVISCDFIGNALIGFSNVEYELVITDLFMSGMGRTEGMIQIRKENSKMPIIAISTGLQKYAVRF